jgi:hypothetical protein
MPVGKVTVPRESHADLPGPSAATSPGQKFQLNGGNFPEFAMAIWESIDDPTGWVEFGQPNQGETYLRITTGHSQGESTCMPFVMEI